MRRTASTSLPRLRWRSRTQEPLVPKETRDVSPALAADLDVLERELLPTFYEHDEAALRAQNAFRLGRLIIIGGGALATVLGTTQAALGGGVAPIGIAEALVAGALAAVTSYVRGRRPQGEYFTARLKAERLRGHYFLYLGHLDPYDVRGETERIDRLRTQVVAIDEEGSE